MADWVTRYVIDGDVAPARPGTPAEAVGWLVEGNRRFVDGAAGPLPPPGGPLAPRQAPYGVVLGCSDARVPLEVVFDAEPNQLFVVRVAGNVLGDECLGSIEYALASFRESVKTLVVTGHTGCGAVAAAVDTYLSPKHHAGIAFSRSLRAVVNHILASVRGAALSIEQVHGKGAADRPGYAAALAEVAVFLNAATAAYHLRLEVRPEGAGVGVVYGVYDLARRTVGGPVPGGVELLPAPEKPEELVALGTALAAAPRVAAHLAGGPA